MSNLPSVSAGNVTVTFAYFFITQLVSTVLSHLCIRIQYLRQILFVIANANKLYYSHSSTRNNYVDKHLQFLGGTLKTTVTGHPRLGVATAAKNTKVATTCIYNACLYNGLTFHKFFSVLFIPRQFIMI